MWIDEQWDWEKEAAATVQVKNGEDNYVKLLIAI